MMDIYNQINTLDFLIWKGWPAKPLNLFALAIQIGTGDASHVSIAHKEESTGRVSHFEAVASGFRQNAFTIHDRGLICIRRLKFDELFEPDAIMAAKLRMLGRMYQMCDERMGYGYGNILAAAAKIALRYKTPNRQPIFDGLGSTMCSEAASRIVRLCDFTAVRVPFENAVTGNDMADAWVWPVHFLTSEYMTTIYEA